MRQLFGGIVCFRLEDWKSFSEDLELFCRDCEFRDLRVLDVKFEVYRS